MKTYYVHNDLHRNVKVCKTLSEAERNTDQFCRVVQIETLCPTAKALRVYKDSIPRMGKVYSKLADL
jgi:hypothetical protein